MPELTDETVLNTCVFPMSIVEFAGDSSTLKDDGEGEVEGEGDGNGEGLDEGLTLKVDIAETPTDPFLTVTVIVA